LKYDGDLPTYQNINLQMLLSDITSLTSFGTLTNTAVPVADMATQLPCLLIFGGLQKQTF